MSDVLSRLERWCRKYYTFELHSGPHYQPGDGTWIRLRSPARKVEVDDLTFEMERNLLDEDGDTIPPTLTELVEEALRRWDADTSTKLFDFVMNEKGEFPPALADGVKWKTDTGNSCVYITANSEDDVREKVRAAYAEVGREPPPISVIYERKLL